MVYVSRSLHTGLEGQQSITVCVFPLLPYQATRPPPPIKRGACYTYTDCMHAGRFTLQKEIRSLSPVTKLKELGGPHPLTRLLRVFSFLTTPAFYP